MIATMASRTGKLAGVALLAALALAGCRETPVEPRLRLSVQGATLVIRIENYTTGPLQVPENFLDRSRPQEIALQVTTERGNPVAMCNDVAYVDGADLRTVAPTTAGTVDVDLVTVMQTHCLQEGRPYNLQAVLVGGRQPGVPIDIRSNTIVVTLGTAGD